MQMDGKLALLYKRVKVRYSKRKDKGRITLNMPKKFVGYSAIIRIYARDKSNAKR